MRIRFDRGTIVFDRPDPGIDPAQLLGATWDLEHHVWRLPAERLTDVRGRLSAKRVRVLDQAGHPAGLEPTWTLPELRWYQREAIGAWRDAGDRGVIALPTGSGKTLAAIAAAAELSVATLVLVPTRVLLDQWVRALAGCWPHVIGRLGDGDYSVAPITVTTYASATSWAPRIGDRFGLVIVDEAHHVGAWCPAEVLEMLVAPARLGLTATPTPPGSAVDRKIGPLVYALAIEELVGDGLAPYKVETVDIQLDRNERERYRVMRGQFNRFYSQTQRENPGASWREVVRIAQRSPHGRDAMVAWRGSRAVIAYPEGKRAALRQLLAKHAGDRVLVFTADNATAYTIARDLLVMPITCDIGRAERELMVERFRTGESSVLVSSQVLDEGFDVPDAEVAIIVGGTGSERRHVQRIGRVLRPRPGKQAHVYELAALASVEIRQVESRRRGLGSSDELDGAFVGAHHQTEARS
ncbi:MAG: DEAD/DEAH box helicase [Kofleriaceae bacterium]|nr:DEAD/DEAH box helicase [Kofleriaceae bacterium]